MDAEQEGRTRTITDDAGPAPTKANRARSIPKAKDKPAFARLTINLPNGPVPAAIKREAAKDDLSLSQAGYKALARGARRADLDVEDRLGRLEKSLADHRRATARDFGLTQELIVAVAQVLCERLPEREMADIARQAAERDVAAMLARVVRTMANTNPPAG
jgi:hypothetical protein